MALKPSAMPDTTSPTRRRRRSRTDSSTLHSLIASAKVELIPMKSLDRAIGELRPNSRVSMTCSPAKSIEATLDECERLLALGHRPVPHVSARMVTSPAHLVAIRDRLVELELREIFVVGGDSDPPGCFFDAIEFLDAFLALDDADGRDNRQVDHIGYTAYPDHHPVIDDARLHDALHTKQEMILRSGRTGHVSTQMCFSADQIRQWLRRERASGLTVPVHLGVPGVIDKSRLMTMGMRLGVGTSLRYLKKNRRAIGTLMAQRSYRPDTLLKLLAPDLWPLGIEGIHLFTFNQVDATEAWRERALART